MIAGTHAPGRGERVEGLRGWLGDIITAGSCCGGWNGQTTMPTGGKVDGTRSGLTHSYLFNIYKSCTSNYHVTSYNLVPVTHDLLTRK